MSWELADYAARLDSQAIRIWEAIAGSEYAADTDPFHHLQAVLRMLGQTGNRISTLPPVEILYPTGRTRSL